MVCVFLLLVWKRATKLLWMTWIDSNLQLAKKWQRRIWQRSMKLSGIEEVNRCDFPSSLQCEVEVSTGRSQSDKITQQILVDMDSKIWGRRKSAFFFFFCIQHKDIASVSKSTWDENCRNWGNHREDVPASLPFPYIVPSSSNDSGPLVIYHSRSFMSVTQRILYYSC